MDYIPIILIAAVIELVLVVTAIVHIVKHPKYRFGSQAMWIIIVVLFNIIGCLVYFTVGKGDE